MKIIYLQTTEGSISCLVLFHQIQKNNMPQDLEGFCS